MKTRCQLPWIFLTGLMLAAPARLAAWWTYGVPSNNNVGILASGDINLNAIRPSSSVPVYVNAGTEGGQWWQLEYIYINGVTVVTHPGSTGFGGWLSFTAPSAPGNYTAYFWCKDGRGVESYWLGLNYTVTNAAPTVDWHTLPPSPLYVGTWFPVRATGVDSDENLGGVWVEFSVNGGAWQGLAYDPAGVNGGSRGATTSNNNGVTAGPPGTTYKFRCHAHDLAGYGSGWRESAVYTVADRQPLVTLAAAGLGTVNGGSQIAVSVANGTTLNFTSAASDPDGNFARIRTWVNYNSQGWVVVRDDASASYNWAYTLAGIGTYQFHSRAMDAVNVESATAIINVTATNRAPTMTLTASPASLNFGQTTAITSGATDPDGNLAFHGILAMNQARNNWFRSPRTDHSTGWGNHSVSNDFVSENYTSGVASGGANTRTAVHRPSWAGTTTYHSNANDGSLWESSSYPAMYADVTVNRSTPNQSGWASRSWTGTGNAPAGAFNVTLTNPYSGAVPAPTGAASFSIVSASGAGASPTSGAIGAATLFRPGTYVVRCSYPGDSNYLPKTWDVTFTVANRPPTASFSLDRSTALLNDTVTVAMTVDDPDGNMDYTNLWVATPTLGRRWVQADNSVVTGGALDRNHSATAYGATGVITRTFTFTTGQGVGNYTFSLVAVDVLGARLDAPDQTVVVSKITPTIQWAPPAAITYGTPLSSLQLNARCGAEGTFVYSPVAGAVLNAGTHTLSTSFTPADPATYNTPAVATVRLTVNKAPLFITANSMSKVYGTANPALTASYAGLVNGDSPTDPLVISGVSLSTTATADSWVGGYDIVPSGGAASNYSLSHVKGTLTITPKPVSFTFSNLSLIYNGTPTTVATPQGPTIHYPAGVVAEMCDRTGDLATLEGNYLITVGISNRPAALALGAGNFTGTNSQAWGIGCCPATVTLGNLSQTYNGTPKSPSVATVPAGLTVNFSYTSDPGNSPVAAAINAGRYRVTGTVQVEPDANGERWTGDATGLLTILPAPVATTTAVGPVVAPTYSPGAQSLAVSATVTGAGSNHPTAGTVTFVLNRADNSVVALSPATAVNGAGVAAGSIPIPAGTLAGAGYYLTAAYAATTAGNFTWQASSANGAAFAIGKATPVVTWNNPAPITYGTALSAIQLNATTDGIAGNFAYTPPAGTVLNAGESQSLSVTFTPTDAANYIPKSKTATITVNPAPVTTTTTVGAIAPPTYNIAAQNLAVTATVAGTPTPAAGAISFALKNSGGTTIATGNASVVSGMASMNLSLPPGTPAATGYYVTAAYAQTTSGNFTWNASNGTGTAFAINPLPVPTTTTISPVAARTYSPSAQDLSVTATVSGSPTPAGAVTFTLKNSGGSAVASVVEPVVGGSATAKLVIPARTAASSGYSVTAAYAQVTPANYAWQASGATTPAFSINRATPQLTWASPAAITYRTQLGSTQLNATANVLGSFAYTPASGTILGAGVNQSLAVVFTPTDAANYTTATASVSLTVNKADQAPITFAPTLLQTCGASQTLHAGGGSGTGGYAYSITGQTPTGAATLSGAELTASVGTGSVTVQAKRLGDGNYNDSAPLSATIAFAKAPAAFRFENLSQVYDGSAKSAKVTTVPGGLTVSVAYTRVGTTQSSPASPTNAGDYTVTATVDSQNLNYDGSASATLTIRRGPQTVSISPLSPSTVLGRTVSLTAKGGQNGYIWGGTAAGQPGTAAVTFTPSQVGTVAATVYSAAGGNYEQSNVCSVAISVAKATPRGVFGNKTRNAPYAVPAVDLDASFLNSDNNSVPPEGAPVSYVTDTGVVLAPGVTLAPGSYVVTATYPGDTKYTSSSVTATFAINKITPTITWTPGPISYGASFGTAQLNAKVEGVAGTFAYTPTAGTVATAAGPQQLLAVFTPSDPSVYDGTTKIVPIMVEMATQTIAITPDPLPARTYGGTALNIEATASSGLPVSISVTNPGALAGPVAASTSNGIAKARAAVRSQGAGTVTVTATQPGNTNYHAATPVIRTYTIGKATQTIRFDNPGDRVLDNAFELGATASSGLPVTYTYSTPNDLTVSFSGEAGSIATAHALRSEIQFAGLTITAHQAGDSNYAPAIDVSRAFNVGVHGWLVKPPAVATKGAYIQFTYRSGKFEGPVPYPPYSGRIDPLFYYKAPSATTWASCGGPDGALSEGLPAGEFVVFGRLTLAERGHYEIALAPVGADGAANLPAGFSPTSTIVGVDVKDAQTITLSALQSTYLVNETITLVGSASSGLALSYSVVGPATLAGSSLQFTGPGQVTVTATQVGDTNYAPATSITRIIDVIAAPILVVDGVVAPANADGRVTGTGYALDYGDGAPITVALYVDGVLRSNAVTTGLPRADVRDAAVANRWTKTDAPNANAGWSFAYDTASLSGDTHELWLVATNSNGLSTTSATVPFRTGKNGQVINVTPVGLKRIGAPAFDLVATASSGQPVSFAVVSGPASLSGANNAHVTLGAHGGTVTLRASVPATATFAAASVDFSFVLGDPDDMDGDSVSDKWEERFSLDVTATSDANGDGILDVEEYALWRDPTASTSHLTPIERMWSYPSGAYATNYIATLMTNGPGTVTLTKNGHSRAYDFNGGPTDGQWRTLSSAGDSSDGPSLLDEGDRSITTSSPSLDYIILVRADPRNKRTRPWDILLNDHFVDGITKAEIEANGGVLNVRQQLSAGLPFGAVDLSRLETTRIIQLGLGSDQSGRAYGDLVFNAGSYAHGTAALEFSQGSHNFSEGGVVGLSFRVGAATGAADRWMRRNQPTHFQVRTPFGYVDVEQSRWSSTVTYYAIDGSYAMPADNSDLINFGAAAPLVRYQFSLDLPKAPPTSIDATRQNATTFQGALAFAMTRTAGTDSKLFECRTDWYRDIGPSTPINESPSRNGEVHPVYTSTVSRQWPARTPNAARGSLTELIYESARSEKVINSEPTLQAYSYIRLTKRQFADDTPASTVKYFEKRGYGDDSLENAPESRWLGLDGSIDSHFEAARPAVWSPGGGDLIGALDISATGGTVYTENFWSTLTTPSYGSQPVLALGLPRQRRQSFLDSVTYVPSEVRAGLSMDVVTTFAYSPDLYDGRTLVKQDDTTQNGVALGKTLYSYATPSLGGRATLETTATASSSASAALTTVSRSYSRRLADPVFRGRPASTKRPDGTQVSYAYQRGTWSDGTWTAGTAGEHLLVAELHGKASSSTAAISSYRGATIDALELDPNKSAVTEKIYDSASRLIGEAAYVYTGDGTYPLLSSVTHTYNKLGNLTTKTANSGQVLYSAQYTGFRKEWETDEQGITLSYTYDTYDRVATMTRSGATDPGSGNTVPATTTTYIYDEIGRVRSETVTAAGTSEQLVTSYGYDTASRPTSTTAPGGFTTSIAYDSPTQTTTTLPGGGKKIVALFADGRARSVTGDAVADSSSSYAYNASGKLITTATTAGQTTSTEIDWLGRSLSSTTATWGNGTTPGTRLVTNRYNKRGQLVNQATTSGGATIAPTRLLEYDTFGRLQREASTTATVTVDATTSDNLTAISVSTDFGVKDYESGYTKSGVPSGDTANWYRYDRVKVYPYDGTTAALGRYASQTYTQASGLGATTSGHAVSLDADHNLTETATVIDRAHALVTTASVARGTTATFGQVTLNGLVIKSTNAQGQATLQTYDELGRLATTDDPRIKTTDFEYWANTTLVKYSTTPDSRSTGYAYDSAGRVSAQTNAANKSAYFRYDPAGNLTHQWGDTVNPIRHEYNELGQRTTMHTYRSGDWTTAAFPTTLFAADGDVTTWNYQSATGLLASKLDANSKGPSYEYNAMGQIGKRTDARNVVTTYGYTTKNLLETVQYNDGLTSNLGYGYDRTGRKTWVKDAAGSTDADRRTFGYYDTSTDAAEAGDLLNKSARLKTETLPSFLGSHTLKYSYQYDIAGRANGAVTGLMLDTGTLYDVTYGYDAVLRLNRLSHKSGAAFAYTYAPDSNLVAGVSQTGGYARGYTYRSDGNRLDRLTHQWGSLGASVVESRLTYNTVGLRETEKTSGSRHLAALGRSDFGVHADYSYDDRLELASSGKYQIPDWTLVNGLNQGSACDFNYDPIGNRTSDQDGSYTPNKLNQYDAIPLVGTLPTDAYDANGNLLKDGVRSYAYDAENRLIKVTQGSSVWNYKYDYLGRRIEKSGPGFATIRFVYDGWNLIAELDGSGTIQRRHVWGLDVSGSLQGAGGNGGLLLSDDGTTQRYPIYDAGHNVIGLYDGSGATLAAYEYDPFGNVQSLGGTAAASNPFRSATKYTDSETSTGTERDTGLVYYGMRFYSPKLGRFINRDPIEEQGGANLYAFCGNDGVNRFDVLGMADKSDAEKAKEEAEKAKAAAAQAKQDAEAKGRKEAYEKYGYIGSRVFGQGGAATRFAGDKAYADSIAASGQFRNSSPEPESYITDSPLADGADRGGTINPESKGDLDTYLVRLNPETRTWEVVRKTNGVTTKHAFVNGITGMLGRHAYLGGRHLQERFGKGVTEFTLLNNPSKGFFRDIFETAMDKLGLTSAPAKALAGILEKIQASGSNVQWVAHSQGGAIFSEAMSYAMKHGATSLSANSVVFDSGANNRWVTGRIAASADVRIDGYYYSSWDAVPNVVGMNGNPVSMLGSVLAAPLLFANEDVSPHTLASRHKR